MILKWLPLMMFFTLISCGKNSTPLKAKMQESSTADGRSCFPDHRVLPAYSNRKNYLSFENFGSGGIGRCRGHALVAQHFEMLAKFNPQKSHPCKNQDDIQCYDTLYSLISKVLEGNIIQIGGFDSLSSFSLDKIAQQVLRLKVASISHRYQASDSPLASYTFNSRNQNVFYDIIRRIKLKHRPYVGIEGKIRIGDHAILAYEVQKNKICVRDPNIALNGEPESCQNFIYLKEGEIFYHQITWQSDEELLSLSLQTDEDDRVQQYIKIHYQQCRQ